MTILLIIFFHSLRSTEKNLLHHKLFTAMLAVAAVMLVVDVVSRFDGHPGTLYAAANQAGNFVMFLISPLLPSLWLFYICCNMLLRDDKMRFWHRFLIVINVINAVMLVLTQFYGWYYTISPENIYSRGPLFWFPVAITAFLLVCAYGLMIRCRQNVDKKRLISLLLFPIPTVVGSVLQISWYGISLSCSGVALSALFAFITLQNDRMNTDFLTGAYNRNGLEAYIRQKINACCDNRTFSAILLDLDNFKAINDTFGHSTGDEVLISTVKVMKSCLHSGDFIARFGGDEFVIILGITDPEELEMTACKIRDGFAKHLNHRIEPLTLDVSMGYAVYDSGTHKTAEEFQRHLDAIMYLNKRANKSAGQKKSALAGCAV
jgi:diguanylate cyclase (GGDEF)-like protein